jgi:hypothetical protein
VTRAGLRAALRPRLRPALNAYCDHGNGEIDGDGPRDIDLARRGLLIWGMSCSIVRPGAERCPAGNERPRCLTKESAR